MRKRDLACLALALCLLAGAASPAGAFDQQGFYRQGMAPTQEGGKWGYMGGSGLWVVPPHYDEAGQFAQGMATVRLNGRVGVIRPDGCYLLQPEYDALTPVGCGLYLAQKGERWGVASVVPYRDGSGRTSSFVYPLEYTSAVLGEGGELLLTGETGETTAASLSGISNTLLELGVEGSQFPLGLEQAAEFNDVRETDWFALWAQLAAQTGIMRGAGDGSFSPLGEVTVAEAVQMAANMDCRYQGDSLPAAAGASQWYSAAVSYCRSCGILTPGQFDDYTRPITRWELACLLDATSLAQAAGERNDRARIQARVKDLYETDPRSAAVYDLYAKGVLTGVDEDLTFRPYETVTRAEAAAMAVRLARPEQRAVLSR